MNLRTTLCFEISRRLLPPPAKRTIDYQAYEDWRTASLSRSWDGFSDSSVFGKDVLDFGCGDGPLSFFLATTKHPRRIIGVDINQPSIERARAHLSHVAIPPGVDIEFRLGSTDGLPVPDQSIDTLVAFD